MRPLLSSVPRAHADKRRRRQDSRVCVHCELRRLLGKLLHHATKVILESLFPLPSRHAWLSLWGHAKHITFRASFLWGGHARMLPHWKSDLCVCRGRAEPNLKPGPTTCFGTPFSRVRPTTRDVEPPLYGEHSQVEPRMNIRVELILAFLSRSVECVLHAHNGWRGGG